MHNEKNTLWKTLSKCVKTGTKWTHFEKTLKFVKFVTKSMHSRKKFQSALWVYINFFLLSWH